MDKIHVDPTQLKSALLKIPWFISQKGLFCLQLFLSTPWCHRPQYSCSWINNIFISEYLKVLWYDNRLDHIIFCHCTQCWVLLKCCCWVTPPLNLNCCYLKCLPKIGTNITISKGTGLPAHTTRRYPPRLLLLQNHSVTFHLLNRCTCTCYGNDKNVQQVLGFGYA